MRLTGVILAGGLGSRLSPLTKITNKHLLPVYNKPMIYYPIEAMVEAGIKNIVLVTGGNHAGDFLRLLGDGRQFGLHGLHYVYQEGEGGIAAALGLVSHITKGDHLAVMLGDNLFENSIKPHVEAYKKQNTGAYVLLKEVQDPQRFGVALTQDSRIVGIAEKPKNPQSNMAVTGLYFYDANVFKIIEGLKPSDRNELEITDVNNHYASNGLLGYGEVKGWWSDCGTFQSLFIASRRIEESLRK